MNLLELVIIAHRCRSTHHFIAFDALQLLQGKDAGDWKNLALKSITSIVSVLLLNAIRCSKQRALVKWMYLLVPTPC